MLKRNPSVGVAAIALLTHLVLGLASILTHAGDPAVLVRFTPPTAEHEASPGYVAAAEERGRPPAVPGEFGHDGEQFWILARDPLLLDPPTGPMLDRPSYRAQRVLYPLLAWPAHALGGDALYWWMFAVGLIAVGAGSWLTAELAREIGAPPLAGLIFALSPTALVSTLYSLSDTLSLAALVGVALALRRGRWGWAVVAAVVAVLTKESSILAVGGIAVLAPSVEGATTARRAALVGVPLTLGVGWAGYVRWRLDGAGGESQELVVVPFAGFAETIGVWTASGLVVGAGVVILAVLVLVRWWRRRTPELAMCVPYALMVPFLAHQVLYRRENSLRALGPVIVLYGLDVLSARRRQADAVDDAPASGVRD